jgi:hypothetical protein
MRNTFSGWTRAVLAVGVLAAPLALAAEARPNADEECVMHCDEESDKCMSAAGADEEKAKACDDKYGECLSKCR